MSKCTGLLSGSCESNGDVTRQRVTYIEYLLREWLTDTNNKHTGKCQLVYIVHVLK